MRSRGVMAAAAVALLLVGVVGGALATRHNLLPGGALYNRSSLVSKVNEARTQGHSDGYGEGQSAGYESGHSAGYDEGHSAGYDEGKTEGYDEGQAAAAQDALSSSSAAYDEGHSAGYSEGYSAGVSCAAYSETPYDCTASGE